MRIGITGSRHWHQERTIDDAIVRAIGAWSGPKSPDGLPVEGVTIIQGCCPTGADRMAVEIAERRGYKIDSFEADWPHRGRAAGPVRNQQMVNSGADVWLAFILPDSKGTTDCVRRAETAGIPVQKYYGKRRPPEGQGDLTEEDSITYDYNPSADRITAYLMGPRWPRAGRFICSYTATTPTSEKHNRVMRGLEKVLRGPA